MREWLTQFMATQFLGGLLSGKDILILLAIGLLNDLVQRYPGLRANSLFQLLPNLLKASPLGRMPLVGKALEALDTPEPPKPKPPAPPTA